MGDQVQRFVVDYDGRGEAGIDLDPTGWLVRYSDYEKLKRHFDSIVMTLDEEESVSQEARAEADKAEAERDQARKQVLEEVRRRCSEHLVTYRPEIDGDRFPVVLVEALENELDEMALPDQSKGEPSA